LKRQIPVSQDLVLPHGMFFEGIQPLMIDLMRITMREEKGILLAFWIGTFLVYRSIQGYMKPIFIPYEKGHETIVQKS
jgi:hypothetical protein